MSRIALVFEQQLPLFSLRYGGEVPLPGDHRIAPPPPSKPRTISSAPTIASAMPALLPALSSRPGSSSRGAERLARSFWLPVIGPVVPDLVGEVTAEETAYLLCSGILAVEESTRGKIVGLPVDRELPVGDEDLVRVVLGIAKAREYLFGRGI